MAKQAVQITFPYSLFPVLIVHKDGKNLEDTKKCYFQSVPHAEKYIQRCKFGKKDYQLYVKPESNVETVVPSTRKKRRKK